VTGGSGTVYQVELFAFWDGGRKARDGNLLVVVAVDDGGWSAFSPLTDDFIIAPTGVHRRVGVGSFQRSHPVSLATLERMAVTDHNPQKRRLHLPIVGVTNGPGVEALPGRKPPWLKVRLVSGPNYEDLKGIMRERSLHTVCEEAMCPNIRECWEEREATFLILGSKCTRRCGFCDVMTAKPDPVDEDEPARIAGAVLEMGLRYVVLTGVARDDLEDGGARIWASAIRAVRQAVPGIGVEVLPSDFKGGERDIATVLAAEPDVFAHNLETVPRLHERIRPAFGYDRSLEVLRFAKRKRSGVTKSNLILGMGERADEVLAAMADLRDAGIDILTMGQYLQPTTFHLPIDRWVHPDEFAEHKRVGERMGIAHVEAGPLVRSSYHAGKQLKRAVEAGVAASLSR
jgi:lipoic acid synthetase